MATGGNVKTKIGDSTITIVGGVGSGAIPKRAAMDNEGFEFPKRTCNPLPEQRPADLEVRNRFLPFSMETDQTSQPEAGPSTAPQAQPSKPKRMPPIFIRVPVVESSLVSALKMAGPSAYFEYVPSGLKVMTKDLNDHTNITKLLQIQKKEYFTFNPTPGATARFVLKGLPPNATCEEIAAGLKSSGIKVSHVSQIKKGRVDQETREKTLIPLAVWIITIEKAMENIANLKALTGLNHFRIRITDYRAPKRQLQCFRCQSHGHKADFCHLQQRCLKCAGSHSTQECSKSPMTAAKCANCQGDHPASYRQCPVAVKYSERKIKKTATAPNLNSRRDFPSLPSRPIPQPVAAPQVPSDSDSSGLMEIIQLLRSGKIKTYLAKLKLLMASVKSETDTLSKMTTFFVGLMDLFED